MQKYVSLFSFWGSAALTPVLWEFPTPLYHCVGPSTPLRLGLHNNNKCGGGMTD